MNEQSKIKNKSSKDEYKKICRAIQKECRKAKEVYYNNICNELEDLDRKNNPKLFSVIKNELRQQKAQVRAGLKGSKGDLLMETADILTRWEEYVADLYADDRTQAMIYNERNESMEKISEEEMKRIIEKLPKNKATGVDDIPAEFIQCCGQEGIAILTSIINKIYETGELTKDFLTSIFIPIPKVPKAMNCEEFRTISLITHVSKILLHIVKERITPLIKNHLSQTQFRFRKGQGTREAIYVLRTLGERMWEHQKDLCITFIDFTKAFDRVNHHKLNQIMEAIGIHFHERRVIANLYWNQIARVRCKDELTNEITIEKGVRQGCVLSPVLFNLYSEKLICEALDETEGVKINSEKIKTI